MQVLCQTYDKFAIAGSVEDNYKGNNGSLRIGGTPENITATHEEFIRGPGNFTRRFSAECYLPQSNVRRIRNKDLGMPPGHVQTVQILTL